MILIGLYAGLLSVGALSAIPSTSIAPERIEYAQVTTSTRVMIKIPTRIRPRGSPDTRIEWREGRGPRCIPARAIAAGALTSPDSIDLLMRDRSRLRARIEKRCPALDYYRGFYILPSSDGQICADRDQIRSRMGGACEIDAFRKLTPKKRD